MIVYLSKKSAKDTLTEQPGYSPKQWIRLFNPSRQEIEEISQKLNLEPSLLSDANDIDEMPRFEIDNEHGYLFCRYARKSSNGQIQTSPILFVINEVFLLTISPRKFDLLDNVFDTKPELTTNNPRHLLLPLLNQCVQSYGMHLATIGRQIRTARNTLRDEKFSNNHFVKFVELEDILNDFLSELVPINNILMHLLAGRKNIKFSENDKDILEDLQLETAQLIDESKGYLKTIVNIREAYSNIMTNNLNRQIKILTTLTIVLTVPTIIGSFFGMNVKVPFADNPMGFTIVMIATTVSSVAILLYLKSKDWL